MPLDGDLLRRLTWSVFMRQERVVFRNLLASRLDPAVRLRGLKVVASETQPEPLPAWRRAIEGLEKDRASSVLPALPPLSNPSSS